MKNLRAKSFPLVLFFLFSCATSKKIEVNQDVSSILLTKAKNHSCLADIIVARERALKANAKNIDVFKEMERKTLNFTKRLSQMDKEDISKKCFKLVASYNSTEIKAKDLYLLKNARDMLIEGQKRRAHFYFKDELSKASDDIEKASAIINDQKNNMEKIIAAIENAENSARRFLSLTTTGEWLSGKTIRELSIEIDRDLSKVLEPLYYKGVKYMPYNEKIKVLKSETSTIPLLLNELTAVQYDAYLQKRKLKKIKGEINGKQNDKK